MRARWQIHLSTDEPPSAPHCIAGIATSPFGKLLVVTCDGAVCMIHFIVTKRLATETILTRWPLAQITWDDRRAAEITNRLISATPSQPGKFDIALSGTPFQLDVWRALLDTRFGQTTSYRQLAATSGHPSAIRATGTAVGANPVAILVPCHRVIRADGSTGQYRWGTTTKRRLLAWEARTID